MGLVWCVVGDGVGGGMTGLGRRAGIGWGVWGMEGHVLEHDSVVEGKR